MQYIIKRTKTVPLFRPEDFKEANVGKITNERPENKAKPDVQFRFLHDKENIYGFFTVKDRYVRAVATKYQDSVCQDSCCEFFFKPDCCKGYFNLEMSVGGKYLLYYVTDPTRAANNGGMKKYKEVPAKYGQLVTVKSDMPSIINPEIKEPTTWHLMFTLPMAALECCAGEIGSLNKKGRKWTMNVYKCGDRTSHPHWLSWAPITELNFHLPNCFQDVIFE